MTSSSSISTVLMKDLSKSNLPQRSMTVGIYNSLYIFLELMTSSSSISTVLMKDISNLTYLRGP